MTAHKHAANMALYAQDAAETDRPWERWQVQSPGYGPWAGFIGDPTWDPHVEYRRKPRTIRIGEFDVPEPLRNGSIEFRQNYWVVDIVHKDLVRCGYWTSNPMDCEFLDRGLIHATREAAELHAKALISLSAKS